MGKVWNCLKSKKVQRFKDDHFSTNEWVKGSHLAEYFQHNNGRYINNIIQVRCALHMLREPKTSKATMIRSTCGTYPTWKIKQHRKAEIGLTNPCCKLGKNEKHQCHGSWTTLSRVLGEFGVSWPFPFARNSARICSISSGVVSRTFGKQKVRECLKNLQYVHLVLWHRIGWAQVFS